MCVCLSGAFDVHANLVKGYIYVYVRQVFSVRLITGKRRRVTLWAYPKLTQAVICELGECVGSVSRELGFTTLEQRSREACMRFIPPPLHPTCFPSVRLVPSPPCLCVCYLTLRYARNSTSLLFLPRQLGCMYSPPPRSLMLPLPPSQALFSDATNFAFF